ncbi:MAG: signal transduction histidine kinase/CheY-like chemotaxis protein [Polyangiales bacterium]|jgi:signal transduction histidine kinase/CheY-like chemotaxis protein
MRKARRVNLFVRVLSVVLLAGLVTLAVSTVAVLSVVQGDKEAGLVDRAIIVTEHRRDAIRQRLELARAQLRAAAFAVDGGRLLEVSAIVEGTALAVLVWRGNVEVFEAASSEEAIETLRSAGSGADGALVLSGTSAILHARAGGVRIAGVVPLHDLMVFSYGWSAELVVDDSHAGVIQAQRGDVSIQIVAPIEPGLRLETTAPLEPARAAAFATSRRVIVASALVIVPLLLMAWGLSRGVTSPIRSLVRVVRESTTLPITAPKLPNDEVGDLGAAIEELSSRLHHDAMALSRSLSLSRMPDDDPEAHLAGLAAELRLLVVPWEVLPAPEHLSHLENAGTGVTALRSRVDEARRTNDGSEAILLPNGNHVIALLEGERDFGLVVALGEVSGADIRVAELLTRTVLSNLRAANLERRARVGEKLAMLGRLSASVAHEMNTPLAFVNANLLALDDEPLSEDVREMIADAQQGVQRIIRIVRDLSAVSAGGKEASRELVCVKSLIENMAQMARTRRPDGTIDVCVEDGIQIVVDRGRVEQVVLNLVNNALDATGAGGSVRVVARREDSQVVVDVCDDGPGISLGAKERLFEAFYTSKGNEGTGLGLYISRSLAEAHGGTLELASSSSEGTVFRLSLPAELESLTVSPASSSVAPSRPRLLIIDDDAAVVRSMQRWLRKRADVEGTTNAEEGLRWIGDRQFDLVLCDMSMPYLSGRDLVEAVRQDHPHLLDKLVIVSGSTVDTLEGVRVVRKPLDPTVLDSLLGAITNKGAV